MKGTTSFFRLVVSISPPAPTLATAIETSAPNSHSRSPLVNLAGLETGGTAVQRLGGARGQDTFAVLRPHAQARPDDFRAHQDALGVASTSSAPVVSALN